MVQPNDFHIGLFSPVHDVYYYMYLPLNTNTWKQWTWILGYMEMDRWLVCERRTCHRHTSIEDSIVRAS